MVGAVKAFRRILREVARWGGKLRRMLLLAGLVSSLPAAGQGGEALPPAAEVMQRMLEHAQKVADADETPQYSYEKRSLLENLDATGRTVSSEEKIYQVKLIRGLPFNRLVKVQGRELTPEESRREDAREEKFQKRFVADDRRKMAARKQALVSRELLDHYQFVVKERVMVNNRPTLVVSFKPKDGILPLHSIEDRILNRLSGTLWIDEAEADTARVQANLLESVYLGWLGWLGSLTRCELSLDRQRMPDGMWINSQMTLFIQCRKLVASQVFRLTEESRGFNRLQAQR